MITLSVHVQKVVDTPHLLREALSWHANFEEHGHMLTPAQQESAQPA